MSLAPVDYVSGLGQLPDPLRDIHEQVMRGLKQEGARSEIDQAHILTRAKSSELDEAEAYRRDLMEHYGRNPTRQGLAYMLARHPKYHEGLKASLQSMKDDALQSQLRVLGQMDFAARNGRWDVVRKMGTDFYENERQAGTLDADDELFKTLLDSDDPDDQATAAGLIRARIAAQNPEKYGATLRDVGEDARDDEMQPFKVSEQAATTATKQAEAETAPEYYEGRARGEVAQAGTREAEAETAPAYYGGRARGEVAEAQIKETDSAWRAVEKGVEVGLKREQIGNVKSLISTRAKELGKRLNTVTKDEMLAPIVAKVNAGQPLTPGEMATWTALTSAPASVRRTAQPRVMGRGGRGGNRGGQPVAAAAAPRRQPITKQFRNQQTGALETWQLENGKWVR